jgi:hypothetical protein
MLCNTEYWEGGEHNGKNGGHSFMQPGRHRRALFKIPALKSSMDFMPGDKPGDRYVLSSRLSSGEIGDV